MISSKKDLQAYLAADMAFFYRQSKHERIMNRLTGDAAYWIAKYVRLLRKEEYYANVRKDPLGKIGAIFYLTRKNKLGNRLGFRIPRNCFGPGLSIYHHGCIIVNESARIGANCRLHGNNCIGNNGKADENPKIGDDLDLGFGAVIIGNVTLENGVKVGANATVVRSFAEDGITLTGTPAIKK